MSDEIFEQVNNYTKYKLVEMLVGKHKDCKLNNLNEIEEIADDIYLQGGVQLPPNGDPYYSAGITKTFNKGGRVGHKEGGLVKPKINPEKYIVTYSDGTKLYKINSFIRDIAHQIA